MNFEILTTTGILKKVMPPRSVGRNGTWLIRDFVCEMKSDPKYPQKRLFQGIRSVVDQLDLIPIGSTVEIHFVMRGNESFKKGSSTDKVYYNLDEVHQLIQIK